MKKAAILFILSTALFNFTFSADKNLSSPYKGSCSTFLLKHGADPTIQVDISDMDYEETTTALNVAIENGHMEIVELLKKAMNQ